MPPPPSCPSNTEADTSSSGSKPDALAPGYPDDLTTYIDAPKS